MLIANFGYLNLLPFGFFLKKMPTSFAMRLSLNKKEGYPAKVSKLYKKSKVKSAFISSIESRGEKCADVGIVACRKVQSVIVRRGSYKKDRESLTSNALARVLGIDGEVFIGDKALKLYLADPHGYEDLAAAWYAKHRLPFVFARFCFRSKHKYLNALASRFAAQKITLPQYILQKAAKDRGISAKEAREYLKLIYYKMEQKEKKALKLFLFKAKRL